jgi:outer membrane lipoprotein-sorting protein
MAEWRVRAAGRATLYRNRALTFAVATVLAAQLAGCAMFAPKAPTPPAIYPSEPDARAAYAKQLVDALAQRDRALTSLRTEAVMQYAGPTQHGKAREQIAVRRPQNLRIEVMSPFGVALVVAANDSTLQIFRASDNTLIRGEASAKTLDRFARIPLAPALAADLLMELPTDTSVLARGPDFTAGEACMLIAGYYLADGATLELGFDGSQLALVRHRLADARPDYEVRYSDFRGAGNLSLANRIDADFDLAHTKVTIRYKHPVVNVTVADSEFELKPGPSTREIDLDNAHLSSARASD